MFGWFKKSEKMPELTEEQRREEQEFIERVASNKKTTTGETTKIVNLTLAAMDKGIESTKAAREAAKKLQESVTEVGARLQPKKA